VCGSFYIQTFGCQMNKHDSERIAGHLAGLGYGAAGSLERAGLILVNTCYVRERAMTKVYAFLGRLKRLKEGNPALIIGVCGCGAQGEGTRLMERMPWVDFIAGPQQVLKIGELVNEIRSGHRHQAALAMPDQDFVDQSGLDKPQREDTLKAWVTIMEGCNNFCSYCVVPYVRGRERSRAPVDILRECQALVERGYREVTLLGQNVNSYHSRGEMGLDFPGLLELLAGESGLSRVRFVTSHPKDLDQRLIAVMADHRVICNYLHLPVQSGSNTVLAAMNRGYTVEHYRSLITAIKSRLPDIGLTTDIIVGFPGETERDFQDTYDLLEWVQYDSSFVFHYQVRPGTAAARLEDSIAYETKLARLVALVELQKKLTGQKYSSLLTHELEVLVEGPSKRGDGLYTGRTQTNVIVHFKAEQRDIGTLQTIRIDSVFSHSVRGTLVR